MQATIYHIPPFDAEIGGTIKFAWNGNQVFKHRCIIKNNESNEVVYDQTIDSFKYEHIIDVTIARLVNGQKYNAYITVFDINGNESDIQALGESFICLKTPTFAFSNIVDEQIISASSYTFLLSYSQENGELLDSWSVSLYSPSFTVLATSDTIYQTETLSYTFNGFANKQKYTVRAVGKTVNGMDVDTGYIHVSVTYSIRDVFSLLEPTNLPQSGCIQIRSNIVSSEGHPEKNIEFVNGEYVNLKNNTLWYTEGFEFKGDFSVAIVFFGATANSKILNLYSSNPQDLSITVTNRVGRWEIDAMRTCYELSVVSYGQTRVYYSNKIDCPNDDDKIGVCISRYNNNYNIEIENLGKMEA